MRPRYRAGPWTGPPPGELRETAEQRYELLRRRPVSAGVALPVALQLPADARDARVPTRRAFPDSVVERRLVETDAPLAGRSPDIATTSCTAPRAAAW